MPDVRIHVALAGRDILVDGEGNPRYQRVADIKLEFLDEPLAGLWLTGFFILAKARKPYIVHFPGRYYSQAGNKNLYKPYLQSTSKTSRDRDKLRNMILDAYLAEQDPILGVLHHAKRMRRPARGAFESNGRFL